MKFIVTKELGKLAKWLRILGYNTVYFNIDNMSSLIITGLREERTILTRSSKLSGHFGVKILNIKSDFVREQMKQVIDELGLKTDIEQTFSLCVVCNEPLGRVEKKETIKEKIPDYVFRTQSQFMECPKCGRIYWQGSHWGNVSKILEEIFESNQ